MSFVCITISILVVAIILFVIIGKIIINQKTKKLNKYLDENPIKLNIKEQFALILSIDFEKKYDKTQIFKAKTAFPFNQYADDFFTFDLIKKSINLNFDDCIEYCLDEENIKSRFNFDNNQQDGSWIVSFEEGNYVVIERERGIVFETETFKTRKELAEYLAVELNDRIEMIEYNLLNKK